MTMEKLSKRSVTHRVTCRPAVRRAVVRTHAKKGQKNIFEGKRPWVELVSDNNNNNNNKEHHRFVYLFCCSLFCLRDLAFTRAECSKQ